MAREQELPVRRGAGRLPSLLEEDWWSAPPSHWFRRLRDDMEQFMDDLGAGFRGEETRPAVWAPTMEVAERDDEWLFRFDLPGVEPENIDVSGTDHQLTVRAETRTAEEQRERGFFRSERRYGTFQRTLALPRGAKTDQIRAQYRNGVLEVHVPKSEEARARVRRIPVESGQPALAGAKGGETPRGQGKEQRSQAGRSD